MLSIDNKAMEDLVRLAVIFIIITLIVVFLALDATGHHRSCGWSVLLAVVLILIVIFCIAASYEEGWTILIVTIILLIVVLLAYPAQVEHTGSGSVTVRRVE